MKNDAYPTGIDALGGALMDVRNAAVDLAAQTADDYRSATDAFRLLSEALEGLNVALERHFRDVHFRVASLIGPEFEPSELPKAPETADRDRRP